MAMMNLSAGQEERCRHREWTWTQWEKGCGMNWEVRIGTYTLPRVKQGAGKKLLCSAGSSAQCWVMIWGLGGRGRWSGREPQEAGVYVRIELIYFVVQQRPTQHCNATIPFF